METSARARNFDKLIDEFGGGNKSDLQQIPGVERKLFTLLSFSIRFAIVHLQSIQIHILSIVILLSVQLKSLLIFMRKMAAKYRLNSSTQCNSDVLEYDEKGRLSLDDILHMPQHVCIIINEEMRSEELFELCCLISEVFCSVPIKSLTFYQFHGKYLFQLLFI